LLIVKDLLLPAARGSSFDVLPMTLDPLRAGAKAAARILSAFPLIWGLNLEPPGPRIMLCGRSPLFWRPLRSPRLGAPIRNTVPCALT